MTTGRNCGTCVFAGKVDGDPWPLYCLLNPPEVFCHAFLVPGIAPGQQKVQWAKTASWPPVSEGHGCDAHTPRDAPEYLPEDDLSIAS